MNIRMIHYGKVLASLKQWRTGRADAPPEKLLVAITRYAQPADSAVTIAGMRTGDQGARSSMRGAHRANDLTLRTSLPRSKSA
jgi:hypothetical protein